MDYLDIAERFGFPCAALAVFSVAIWRVLKWIAANVVKPLMDRHAKFLDGLSASTKAITQQTAENHADVARRLDALSAEMAASKCPYIAELAVVRPPRLYVPPEPPKGA